MNPTNKLQLKLGRFSTVSMCASRSASFAKLGTNEVMPFSTVAGHTFDTDPSDKNAKQQGANSCSTGDISSNGVDNRIVIFLRRGNRSENKTPFY
jgi:hypothetical protein